MPDGSFLDEIRFVGLYTANVYSDSRRRTSRWCARRSTEVVERSGFPADEPRRAHAGARARDLPARRAVPARGHELAVLDDRRSWRMGLRRRVRLFVSHDQLGCFVSCLVYLPARPLHDAGARCRSSTRCARRSRERSVDFTVLVTESVMARLHVVVATPDGARRRRRGRARGTARRARARLDRRPARRVRRRASARSRSRPRTGAGGDTFPPAYQVGGRRARRPSPTSPCSRSSTPEGDLDIRLEAARPRAPRPDQAVPHRWRARAVRRDAAARAPRRDRGRRATVRDRRARTDARAGSTRSACGPTTGDPLADPAVAGAGRRAVPRRVGRRHRERRAQPTRAARRARRAATSSSCATLVPVPAAGRVCSSPTRTSPTRWARTPTRCGCSSRCSTQRLDPARPATTPPRSALVAGARPRHRRGRQPRRRPHPARALAGGARRGAHQRVPRRARTSRCKLDPTQLDFLPAAAAATRDLGRVAVGRRRAPARRRHRAWRHPLVRSARGLPHRDPRADEGADGEERGDRAGRAPRAGSS